MQFFEEADILSGLSHANIIQLLGIVIDQANNDLIILDFISEGSLDKFLKESPVPMAKLVRFAQEIASGLAYLDSLRIVHNNLAWYVLIRFNCASLAHICLIQSQHSRQSQWRLQSLFHITLPSPV